EPGGGGPLAGQYPAGTGGPTLSVHVSRSMISCHLTRPPGVCSDRPQRCSREQMQFLPPPPIVTVRQPHAGVPGGAGAGSVGQPPGIQPPGTVGTVPGGDHPGTVGPGAGFGRGFVGGGPRGKVEAIVSQLTPLVRRSSTVSSPSPIMSSNSAASPSRTSLDEHPAALSADKLAAG